MMAFKDKPSLEEFLVDPTVRRLLNALRIDFICLTVDQIYDYVRDAYPPEIGAHRLKEYYRYGLNELKKAGIVGAAAVKCLPTATISEAPIFRAEKYNARVEKYKAGDEMPFPELQPAFTFGDVPVLHLREFSSIFDASKFKEFSPYTEIAKHRIPPLEAHGRRTFFFATLMAIGITPDAFPPSGDPHKIIAMHLIDLHRSVEEGAGATLEDIARTRLTAVFNLNQFMLANRFRSKFASEEWRYEARGREEGGAASRRSVINNPDGHLLVNDREKVSLFFLRPMPPDELEAIVRNWLFDAKNLSECWWI